MSTGRYFGNCVLQQVLSASAPASTSQLLSYKAIKAPLGLRLLHKHETKPATERHKWKPNELKQLADLSSNFSTATRILNKKSSDNESKETKSERAYDLFTTHSHSHLHSASEVRAQMDLLEHNKAGSRITYIGIGCNVGMSLAKGVAGVTFNSSALLADAAHSLSDILGDLVTLYTFRKSRKTRDLYHPYGFGRYEALGTLVVSGFLVVAGLGIGWHAIEQVFTMLPSVIGTTGAGPVDLSSSVAPLAHSSMGHHHHHGADLVDPRAIWFAIGSIVVNEALFQATIKVGKRTKSNVLIANAWHHRSDALTSLVSVGAIGGAILGFPILDPLGGLIVSAMLIKSGAQMTIDAVHEITDCPPSHETTIEVSEALDKITQKLGVGYQGLVCRKSGPFVHVVASIVVDPEIPATDAVGIISQVESSLRDTLGFVQNIDFGITTIGVGSKS